MKNSVYNQIYTIKKVGMVYKKKPINHKSSGTLATAGSKYSINKFFLVIVN